MSGSIGYIKYVSFQKKEDVRAIMVSEYGNIQNAFTKEGASVSFFFFFLGRGVGGLFFPGAGLLKQ